MLHEEIKVVSEENVNEYLKEGWEYYGAFKSEDRVQFIVKKRIGEEEKSSSLENIEARLFLFALVLGSFAFFTASLISLLKVLGK
ncbi:hypothetical protein FUSNEC_GEN_129_09285 [Fusobacterium necrophorum subsp. funduliforme]|uniref:hypothetical protein n=1 Tax=Fusobacterium necrophorum TaxID=859 RepID=UPI000788957A|nr:hypothetical protein [Fusobacterium necrophorum]KYM50752.1 hypothetical protein A2U11_08580 [Fusobacterium necrophorum subsp. funduliforme]